ncbi:hypothetical protein AB0M28_18385 [Streptomyces sp. NPDC051940]|uniref:hypothetical protein n=1 Tax=Streptomyces sp. NPDC051940 TaxID=3155675 RepID=UPI003429AD7C
MTLDLSLARAITAGQGRSARQLVDWTTLLVVPVMALVAGLLDDESWRLLALFSPFASFAVWFGFAIPRGVTLLDDSLLSGKTLSGRRTVSFAGPVKVRRIFLPTPQQSMDLLVIKDACGVRLLLDKKHDAEVRAAIEQTAGQVALSQRAAERLGLASRARNGWEHALAVLGPIALCLGTVTSGFVAVFASFVIAGE